MLNDLINYKKLGFTIIPCKQDKSPAIYSWKEYQKGGFPNDNEFNNIENFGFVCGLNGIEVIDIDTKYHPNTDIYKHFAELVYNVFSDKTFLVIQSRSGGYHYYFKSNNAEGNQKLALSEKGQVMFETRGVGGYVLCPPSANYNILSGSYESIPTLTDFERNKLFNIAKSFDFKERKENETDSIFKEYNQKNDILQELYINGWINVKENNQSIFLKRPGKTDKNTVSASFNKTTNTFYCFSTSTNFESEKGLSPTSTYLQLYNCDIKEARRKFIDKGFGKNIKTITKEKAKISEPKDGKENIFITVKKYIRDYYDIQFNEILGVIEWREKGGDDFKDLNVYDLYCELREQNKNISLGNLEAILKSNFIDKYDFFDVYFKSLKYKGDGFIDKLSSYVKCEDQEYWQQMFKKTLVRCISCGLTSNVNRFILVLQGAKQYTGKSTFIRFLNTMPQRYYSESPIRDNKDTQFQFAQTFIYNLEELATLNKKDVETLKSIISQTSVNERRPYDRNNTYMPRRTNFFASTNKDDFLTDHENTRWLVMKIEGINWDYSKEIDMESVWAEAYHLYTNNYDYSLTDNDFNKQAEINKIFETSNIERDLIERYIDFRTKDTGVFQTTADIFNYLTLKMPTFKIKESVLVRQLKQSSGLSTNVYNVDNKSKRGYFVSYKEELNNIGGAYEQKEESPF